MKGEPTKVYGNTWVFTIFDEGWDWEGMLPPFSMDLIKPTLDFTIPDEQEFLIKTPNGYKVVSDMKKNQMTWKNLMN